MIESYHHSLMLIFGVKIQIISYLILNTKRAHALLTMLNNETFWMVSQTLCVFHLKWFYPNSVRNVNAELLL